LAVIVSLVASGLVVAIELASPPWAWLSWAALLPLLFVVRLCRPTSAMLAGGVWGASMFLLSGVFSEGSIASSAGSLIVFVAVPACYALLGARLTRRIGFSPLVLGVGWMGVEFALESIETHIGVLVGMQAEGSLAQWIANAFGYVLVAFLVAYVNASLLSTLSCVRLVIPGPRPAAVSDDGAARLVPQTFPCFPTFAIPVSQPRAPPIECDASARIPSRITPAGIRSRDSWKGIPS
jgi:apolipoprotein N-acyltransferase